MNIVLNAGDYEIVNRFISACKEKGDTVVFAKHENLLFDQISQNNADAYVLTESTYAQKAIDFIKKSSPYTPIVILGDWTSEINLSKADMVMPVGDNVFSDYFVNSLRGNIKTYIKNFEVLKKLTTKMADVIEFGHCKYDPTRRLLFVKDKEVKKMSLKEGGVLEILASNFGEVVKKDVIMEKVWRKSDYFVGRSLDVYTTHVRKALKKAKTKMVIKNISNVGLILEFEPETKQKSK